MRKSMAFSFVVVAAMALMPAVALGVTDTFEDFDPNVTIQGQGDWYTYYGPDHALVEDEPGVAYAGTQYLDFFFTTYSTYPYRRIDSKLVAESAEVSYYFRIGDRFGSPSHQSFSRFWWSAGEYPPATLLSTSVWDDGVIGYYTGPQPTDFVDSGVTINPDEWYKFSYTYDLASSCHWVVTRASDSSVVLDTNFPTEVSNQTLSWSLEFNPANYVYGKGFHSLIDNLTVTIVPLYPPGDANLDGMVTDADYTIWADTYGSTEDLRADWNDDNEVTDADYTIWADNYGEGTEGVAVPEPVTLTLLGLGMLGLLRKRR